MIFAIRIFSQSITDERLLRILRYSTIFFIDSLYPVILSLVLHRKTDLWLNACFFAITGGTISMLGAYLLDAFQVEAWMNVGGILLFVLFFWFRALPGLEHALYHEWDSPFWEKLNDLSLIDFFFLRFDSID